MSKGKKLKLFVTFTVQVVTATKNLASPPHANKGKYND